MFIFVELVLENSCPGQGFSDHGLQGVTGHSCHGSSNQTVPHICDSGLFRRWNPEREAHPMNRHEVKSAIVMEDVNLLSLGEVRPNA